jgi:hypothetical protein
MIAQYTLKFLSMPHCAEKGGVRHFKMQEALVFLSTHIRSFLLDYPRA